VPGPVPNDLYSGLLVQAYRAMRYDRANNPRSFLQMIGVIAAISWLSLVGCLFLGGVYGLIFNNIYLPYIKTIESNKNTELNDYPGTPCHIQMICSKYSAVRQQCAVAGDFNNCVAIKIGRDTRFIGSCTVDGNLTSEIDLAKMPNTVECWVRNAGLIPPALER
jgi:hypothetical protein